MFSFKTMIVNIAQGLLVFFLLPFFAFICEAFSPDSTISGIIGFLGQVPLCATLADILSQYSAGINQSDVLNITIWTFLKEFPSAIIAAISIHFCISLFNIIWAGYPKYAKPWPILPAFLGIFLFTIITNIIGLTGSDLISFLIELGLVVIMLIGMKVMFTTRMKGSIFSIKKILLWVIEGMYAVIISAYVAALMLVLRGATPGNPFGFIALMAGVALIASVLVFFTRLAVDKDEKKGI